MLCHILEYFSFFLPLALFISAISLFFTDVCVSFAAKSLHFSSKFSSFSTHASLFRPVCSFNVQIAFCFSSADVSNSNHRTFSMNCLARMVHAMYSFLSFEFFCTFNLTLPCTILTQRLHFLRNHRWQKVTFLNGLHKVSIMRLARQVLSHLLQCAASAVMFGLHHLWNRRHPYLSSQFVL